MKPVRWAVTANLLFWTLACGHGGEADPKAVPSAVIPVKVLTASAQVQGPESLTTGSIEAVHSVEIRPEAAGQVVRVSFADGDTVTKGQILASLRDDAARAGLKGAEARLALAKSRLDRVARLATADNASKADHEVAVAEHDLALAEKSLAEDTVRRTQIRAPFAGTVGRRLVEVGDQVDPSRVLTRLEDTRTVAVDLSWPEQDLGQLALGQKLAFEVDAWTETFEGEISYLAPRIDTNTRSVAVRAVVDNAAGKLRPGMTARVRQSLGSREGAVSLPTQAVLVGASGPSVFVVGDDNKVSLRPIKLGERGPEDVEVREGVVAGERIVIEGLLRLRPGVEVTIQQSPTAQASEGAR